MEYHSYWVYCYVLKYVNVLYEKSDQFNTAVMSYARNYRQRKKKGRSPNINTRDYEDYDYWNSPTSEEPTCGKGSLKYHPSLDDWENTEESSWRSRSDNLKNSEGWRSSEDWGDLEERRSPENWGDLKEWGSPGDDLENSEECSSKSTTENNSAFSDDFRSIEELTNINKSGDFKNTFNQSQSEVSQEADSENEKDITNKVSNINFSKEIETIYDTSINLSSDFLSALQKNSFTDVSIKCGDYVQQVHKFVLAARSPVFEAMFTTPMEESEKGVVTISDIDASVLDDLLAFIYGAQVKNITLTKACDLLYVAEKYQVKGLKDICTDYLRSCLSIPNAIQILQFADLYDEELKKDVLNYVCENFSALKTTEEWKTLQTQKPNLSIEVYSVVVEKHEALLGSKNSSSPMETPSSIVKTDSWP
nr:kelch-like protein 8 [Parasteatoda tepidariorum]